jgi:hypothetical protein
VGERGSKGAEETHRRGTGGGRERNKHRPRGVVRAPVRQPATAPMRELSSPDMCAPTGPEARVAM